MTDLGPITISADLCKEVWCEIKDMRDLWSNLESEPRAARLTDLLHRMKAAGMANWIPTLDEVVAAGPYVRAEE